MKTPERIKLFLVDDDAVYLKLLEFELLQHGDFATETYATGEHCIANLSNNPDIIILDYHLDGVDKHAMNGIDTLDQIKNANPDIAVVMLSQQDKIEIAIDCMHHNAFDYIVKSETAFLRLQKVITNICDFKKLEKQLNWYVDRM